MKRHILTLFCAVFGITFSAHAMFSAPRPSDASASSAEASETDEAPSTAPSRSARASRRATFDQGNLVETEHHRRKRSATPRPHPFPDADTPPWTHSESGQLHVRDLQRKIS